MAAIEAEAGPSRPNRPVEEEDLVLLLTPYGQVPVEHLTVTFIVVIGFGFGGPLLQLSPEPSQGFPDENRAMTALSWARVFSGTGLIPGPIGSSRSSDTGVPGNFASRSTAACSSLSSAKAA